MIERTLEVEPIVPTTLHPGNKSLTTIRAEMSEEEVESKCHKVGEKKIERSPLTVKLPLLVTNNTIVNTSENLVNFNGDAVLFTHVAVQSWHDKGKKAKEQFVDFLEKHPIEQMYSNKLGKSSKPRKLEWKLNPAHLKNLKTVTMNIIDVSKGRVEDIESVNTEHGILS